VNSNRSAGGDAIAITELTKLASRTVRPALAVFVVPRDGKGNTAKHVEIFIALRAASR